MPVAKARDFLQEMLSPKGRVSRLPLAISILFFFATAAWILFEHEFLGSWEPITKDIFWAILSTGCLFLLLGYGISVIRRSEAALWQSENIRSRILETSTSGIIGMDTGGDITYANLEAANLLGIPRGDIVGKHYRDLPWEITTGGGRPYAEEDLPFSRVGRTGEPVRGVELAVNRGDGTRIILSVNTAPLRDGAGTIAGKIASFFDITDRKEAEDLQLRNLHLAVDQSVSAIAITDAAGRIEYANPVFVRMTGYPREGLLQAAKPCPTDISPRECEQIRTAIASGTGWKGEYWNRHRNGKLYWESAVLTPIRNVGGGVSNFLWVAEDVTEKRLAEDAAGETRERYQNLVEKIHDLVWEINADTYYTYLSPRSHDLLGYFPEELLGKTPFDLMPESEAKRVRAAIAPVLARRRSFEHVESMLSHRDGREVVLTTSGVPFHDPDGTFRGWRGVSRDITSLKKGEEELHRSEERFRQIFEQNEEAAIFFRSGTTGVLDANPAALSLYGCDLEEMRDGEFSRFIDPEERSLFEEHVRETIREGTFAIEGARHVRKDGRQIIVSVRGRSILLREGKVSYCTFRDITARVRAEEEARARQAQLIHASRMASLGTMVSGVAHEINNPNNLIMVNAPMILQAWRDADRILESHHREDPQFSLGGLPYSEMRTIVPRLLHGVSDASHRIKGVVENLKGFSRPGPRDLESPIDVHQAIHTAVGILHHEITKGCQDFRVDYAPDPPIAKGCLQELEQVLINLIQNSLQALPDRARAIRISASTDRTSGTVEIVVRDEGAGMTPDVLQNVTRPFFSTKRASGGLGLGLSVSRSIIEEHRGKLLFESDVGKGTTARVLLPAFDPSKDGDGNST
ncbi:MAG: PAS domain S-box protein [Candidatus Deferrimicrobiaceae bacterium]